MDRNGPDRGIFHMTDMRPMKTDRRSTSSVTNTVERRSDATTKTNPGSKPIKTTTDLLGNILCLELNLLSSQYLKTNIHQSLSLVSGRLPDLHRPSASDFVFLFRPRTQSRSGGFGRLVSGLHRKYRPVSQRLLVWELLVSRTGHGAPHTPSKWNTKRTGTLFGKGDHTEASKFVRNKAFGYIWFTHIGVREELLKHRTATCPDD